MNGWIAGDTWTSTETSKAMGSFFDSTLGVAAASFDITSVPTWGSHLLIMAYLRGTTAALSTNSLLRFNNDSAANYDYQFLSGSATSATASQTFASTGIVVGDAPANTSGANLFSSHSIFIPFFRSANNKVLDASASFKDGTSSGNMFVESLAGFWRSNSAITRLTILPGAGNWDIGSKCTAYVLGP